MSSNDEGYGDRGGKSGLRRRLAAYTPIVFDLDGTLVDSAPGIADALNRMNLTREPIQVSQVRRLVSGGAFNLVREAFGIADEEVPGALQAFRTQYLVSPCCPEHLFPGVEQALKSMRGWGSRLAVCTNKPQALAERVIERLGLGGYFDVVLGSDPSRAEKPDPAPLFEICVRLNGSIPILIGDSMVDARTAQAAGAPFVYAAYGYEPVENVPVAGVATCMADVTEIVEKLIWAPEARRAST